MYIYIYIYKGLQRPAGRAPEARGGGAHDADGPRADGGPGGDIINNDNNNNNNKSIHRYI